ncbi:cob(I)yrinic acid a,c-diamide adenosyltransferase [Desulfuromonas carbonis]|uniref:cob(I)yrinic acid a,c-diamide adenosyltransferase n=1 Tax=Desulfuromonas sp. DDH964 TaxID=1823759 RepID=UPI00078DF985|nr:cob(I)yrinic acid a,c-diamide adenosyltransferase [Desulfuromonas sp. DDH964]AMV73415.1 cob(I)yrinate a,c-diamide adenosyltransferase [Desulfuromonas sp. DDH964]
MPQPGLVQVYTGAGKGKTTAATGLALRALGQGLRVLLVRFLKSADSISGEVAILETLPGIEIITAGIGIIGQRPPPALVTESVRQAFARGRARVLSGEIDLAIFDEGNNALHRGDLALQEVLQLIAERPAHVELLFTGRHAPDELAARADLVTRMEAVRHPYSEGIPARAGIEY